MPIEVKKARRASLPSFEDRLQLGGSGLKVSPFCLGAVDSPSAVRAAFAQGINFFFVTADMHWPLYEPLRKGLRQLLADDPRLRDKIVVGAVCYATQTEFCSIPFEEVLAELPELKRLDLLIAGGAYAREFTERLPVYVRHRKEGFLGASAIGASFHDRRAASHAVNEGMLDIAFARYNPKYPGARRDLFSHIQRPRPTLLFNFASTAGALLPAQMEAMGLPAATYWHPAITDYYRFALSRPELDGLLIAPRTPREISGLKAAIERGPLNREEERYLLDLGLVSRGEARIVPRRRDRIFQVR